MKFIFLSVLLIMNAVVFAQEETKSDTTLLAPLEVTSMRATSKTPVAKTTLSKQAIEKQNTGVDLPLILNQTPSVVVNSDAGNGIGYTGIRIRGSDASRINVTLNNIPYNDAESQGTYFVDLPDIASSANSIQIQRGVGTSTNGAGAFGGSINISTNEIEKQKSISVNNSVGSFGSRKNTVLFHSGIFKDHFVIDARASSLFSNGYIDRASTSLHSYYASAAYVAEKTSVRFNIFTGKEKTYQAWNGIDEETLKTNRTYNSAGMGKPGEPYDNQTDNYTQTHYQLFVNKSINQKLKLNLTGFFTKGKGYYEEYIADAVYADYGLADYNVDTVHKTSSDLVRQLWLDNIFYGNIFSLNYHEQKTDIQFGGGWNNYEGNHYGKIVYMQFPVVMPADYKYYHLTAYKQDYSAYTKWKQYLHKNWESFLDLQVRAVHYTINGFQYNPSLVIYNKYLFFNPKAGITYTYKNIQAFLSYAHAAKEPNRDDFETGIFSKPKAEKLDDIEAGFLLQNKRNRMQLNLFYMKYSDQLVLTGKINDVGAYTRTNVPSSYRAGIEIEDAWQISSKINVAGNLTLSENKIKNFTEYIDDYDNGGQILKKYHSTDLSFSPSVIGNISATVVPVSKLQCTFSSKYVGRQFMDNTSEKSRSLDPYMVFDGSINYTFIKKEKTLIDAYVSVYNIFSKKYEPNGYTFSYLYQQKLSTENFYFPMAPINFMVGLNVKF